jgi:hypothetical protein
MTRMIDKHGLKVATELADFLDTQALPGTGVEPDAFWRGVADIYARFAPESVALLAVRDTLQAKIDAWHEARAGAPIDQTAYQAFLREIGYLVAEPAPFSVAPDNVDDEVARLAGAQLVVPVLNARFLLNAANARWGSLAPRRARVMIRCAGARSSPGPRLSSTGRCRWPRAAGSTGPAARPCWPIPRSWSATPARTSCCATMACISNWWSIQPTRSARAIPPASLT